MFAVITSLSPSLFLCISVCMNTYKDISLSLREENRKANKWAPQNRKNQTKTTKNNKEKKWRNSGQSHKNWSWAGRTTEQSPKRLWYGSHLYHSNYTDIKSDHIPEASYREPSWPAWAHCSASPLHPQGLPSVMMTSLPVISIVFSTQNGCMPG